MCSFEDRALLVTQDLQEINELGLTFRGRNAWPLFRRYEPGYVPWFITTEECVFLTHALQQTLIVAKQYLVGELELDFEEANTVLRRQNDEMTWESVPFDLGVPDIVYVPVDFNDELLIRQLRRAKKLDGVILQADVSYLPSPVQDQKGQRPYFPRLFVLAERKGGTILNYAIYQELEDDASEVLNRLITFCLERGTPNKIQVKDGTLVPILETFCRRLGIKLSVMEKLSVIEDFMRGMAEFGF